VYAARGMGTLQQQAPAAIISGGVAGFGAGLVYAARGMGTLQQNAPVERQHGAESINAREALNRKLATLEKIQNSAVDSRHLPDGRYRFYDIERPASTNGPTRGGGRVFEWNPRSGQVREWYECRDHSGNVNRVHPKMIDGNIVTSPHYPPTAQELLR